MTKGNIEELIVSSSSHLHLSFQKLIFSSSLSTQQILKQTQLQQVSIPVHMDELHS